MKKITHEEIAKKRFTPDVLSDTERFPIYLLLDNIRSLYNVGSVFRTADGARVKKLFLCGYTPHPPRKEIEKTALGAVESVPWEYSRSPIEIIDRLKSEGVTIAVLELTSSSIPYYSLTKKQFPLLLVVGNEITGVSKEVIASADLGVDIPMYGMKQSLNAAIACGIALFGLVKIFNED
jgi:tRNA G18 (ribose-2'-O)-methylase SpoU